MPLLRRHGRSEIDIFIHAIEALIAPTPRKSGPVAANQNKPGIAVGTGPTTALYDRDL
jgi:hypothetical protein